MATLTNFDVPKLADQALQGFVNTLVPINAFSRSYSNDALGTNNQVLVPVFDNVTATTFNGSYGVSGATASVITVTINRHRIVPVSMTDIQRAASSGKATPETFAYQQGEALATEMLQDIWSLLTTANFAMAAAVGSTAIDVAELRAGRLLLSQNKVPHTQRSFVFDNVPYDTLLGISQYAGNLVAYNNSALAEGVVPRALGCDIYETNSLPGTNSVMGFIAHPSAIAVAVRYLQPQPGNTYYDARPLEHAKTGLTIGFRDFYRDFEGTRYIAFEACYGYAVGLTQGARLYGRTD